MSSKRRDLKLTETLTQMGFTECYTIGKTLILCTKTQTIQSRFDGNDLLKTTEKYLKQSLDKCQQYTPEDKDIICTHIGEMVLASVNQEHKQEQDEKHAEQQATNQILDDIKQMREQYVNQTFEEWQSKLLVKYQKLRDIVQEKMPKIWPGLEFELSIMKIQSIEDCTLPFVGIILGAPSSFKTVIIGLPKGYPNTFYTDNFTARSFVSHSTAVSSDEELRDIDLLPKIKDNHFLTPELSPMFTSKEEDLISLLGIITRIADGEGYSSDSGAHGHRGYDEDIMFTWTGAAVDIPYKVYKVLSNLGARMYFFRMGFEEQNEEQLLNHAHHDSEHKARISEIRNTLFDYLKWFEISPSMAPTHTQKVKWKWDSANDSNDALKYIVRMADLLSHLRCVAQAWETRDTQGSDYNYSVSQRESPTRAITHLKNLSRGHALLSGRNFITLDDISIVIKTALDTAPIERVSFFSLLIASNGTLTTTQILDSLNVSRPTALRTMAEFKAIGLVTLDNEEQYTGAGRPSKIMRLKPKFNWLLSDELIKKIIPHTRANSNSNSNYEPSKTTLEELFWQVYDELEMEETATNYTEADKSTVSGKKLEDRLILTGQFYNGDARRIIEDMLEANKLEMVMLDTYRKIR